MEKPDWRVLTIGAVIVLSAIIGMYGIISSTSANSIARENVCSPPELRAGGFDGFWNQVAEKTGIDADSARFSCVSVDIDPDASIDRIDLRFNAVKDGRERSYSIWYRRDRMGCGWIDGLTYPGDNVAARSQKPIHPKLILGELEGIRFSSMGFSGKHTSIVSTSSHNVADPDFIAPDAEDYDDEYLLINGSLIQLASSGSDRAAFPPHDIIIYQRTCRALPEGIVSCERDRSARIVSHAGNTATPR